MTPAVSAPAIADLSARLPGRLVTVEPLRPEHLDGLVAAAADPTTFRWMPEDMTSPDAVRARLLAALDAGASGTQVPFAVLDAATGEPVGSTRFLALALEHLRAEIGWTWVTPGRWGSGVNVETKLLLLDHAFETVGLRRVEFKTDARNERSRGALTALGARFEGIFRRHMVLPDGSARDSAYFSVIDEEWPEVRTAIQRRLEETP